MILIEPTRRQAVSLSHRIDEPNALGRLVSPLQACWPTFCHVPGNCKNPARMAPRLSDGAEATTRRHRLSQKATRPPKLNSESTGIFAATAMGHSCPRLHAAYRGTAAGSRGRRFPPADRR